MNSTHRSGLSGGREYQEKFKIMRLKKGYYYWVVYIESEAFIAQYEGDYWMTDIATPTEKFNEYHRVIKEVEMPEECKNFEIS